MDDACKHFYVSIGSVDNGNNKMHTLECKHCKSIKTVDDYTWWFKMMPKQARNGYYKEEVKV